MLIVAIPKSASTALQATLSRLHDIESYQEGIHGKRPEQFKVLHEYHSDCRELKSGIKEKWNRNDVFFKQHIPPTTNNKKILLNLPKVILLRNPEQIVLSYKRGMEKGIHEMRKEFIDCSTKNDWISRAEEIGLTEDLQNFFNGWECINDTNSLIVYYKELIKQPTKTINKVSKFFDLKSDFTNVMLERARYSRDNKIQRVLYRINKKAKQLFRIEY